MRKLSSMSRTILSNFFIGASSGVNWSQRLKTMHRAGAWNSGWFFMSSSTISGEAADGVAVEAERFAPEHPRELAHDA